MRLTVALSAVILSACSGPEPVISVRQTIHHDDFEYSVESVETMDRIGDRLPAGRFYVLTFQVENRARAVNHRWGNDIAYLVDERGREYENDDSAQMALARVDPFERKDSYVTPAGLTERTRLVFDVPRAVREPYLKVRGFLLMGDVFDGDQFRRTRVKLF
jgi:hypothetical protein